MWRPVEKEDEIPQLTVPGVTFPRRRFGREESPSCCICKTIRLCSVTKVSRCAENSDCLSLWLWNQNAVEHAPSAAHGRAVLGPCPTTLQSIRRPSLASELRVDSCQ